MRDFRYSPRVTQRLELDLDDAPFRDGETLWTWANRVCAEVQGGPVFVQDISVHVQMVDVSSFGGRPRERVPARQPATIEYEVP